MIGRVLGNRYEIIEKVIKISSNHHEYYSIINNFYNHSNFLVRLFCAANGNYTPYLYDKEERVRKIGYIISEFLNFYRHLSDSEREIIDFLKNALDVKAILVTEEKDCYAEFIDASFKSILFNGIITIQNFDADILYRLKDKRILAYKIYKYIKENEIEINFDMFPQEFGKEKTRKLW